MAVVISGNGIDMGNNPVSNASQVEVQQEQVSPFSGFKNYIINGNFDIWQRGISQTTSGYGSADRWLNIHSGSTKTISKQFSQVLSANVMSTVVTSVAGGNNYVRNIHRIEDITKYAGKTITLSFEGKADSNKNMAISFTSFYGTGGTPSAQEDYGLTLVPLATTFGRKTITVTVPSIVGKTLGANGVHTSYLQIQFWFDAGSGTIAAPLGQQSGTFDIAQVQLEDGSVATPFEQRPFGLELSLCQRYYEIVHCFDIANEQKYNSIPFGYKHKKRITPTVYCTALNGQVGVMQGDSSVFSARVSTDEYAGRVTANNVYITTSIFLSAYVYADAEL